MKIALIGYRGHWGYVLRDLARLPEVEIAAISGGGDPVEPMAESVRRYYSGDFALYDDYVKMLDEVECDIVVVDGPFQEHAAMCVAALKHNCHVFCEKPIALTEDDLALIQEAYDAARPGVRIGSMVGLRTEPVFHAAYRAVSSGAIGKVQMVNARKSYKLGQRRDFFKERKTYGGTIPWVGIHAIDWIYHFTGKRFLAVSTRVVGRDPEMAALCQFEMEDGVIGGMNLDFYRPNQATTHGDDRIRCVGTAGVLEVRGGEILLINGEGEQILRPTEAPELLEEFLNGGETIPPEEIFYLTRVAIVARDAADATGKTF
jgi:predicted dehydrogenase